ncbi:MAG: eCIS core domain-containing protein [Gemmatimonadales bacterium]
MRWATASPELALQRALGNRAYGQLIQPKLEVGPPGDRFEQEADRVADAVVNASGPGDIPASAVPVESVQRRCAGCEEDQDKHVPRAEGQGVTEKELESEGQDGLVQRAADGSGYASARLSERIAGSGGHGQPLPEATRRELGGRMGTDFSGVRVHRDSTAAGLCRDLNAHAFTIGHDIYFNSGRYDPHSQAGTHLLAHELTHTLQQESAGPTIQRQSTTEQKRIEPHYPTEDERRRIAELLSYQSAEPTMAAVPNVAPGPNVAPPAPTLGRQLTAAERQDLVGRLKRPFADTLNKMDAASAPVSDSGAVSQEEGFRIAERARTAVYAYFGGYATRNITLTRDSKTDIEQRKAANQVLLTFPDRIGDGETMARNIINNHCAACRAALSGLDGVSRTGVVLELMTTVQQLHGEQLQRVAEKVIRGQHTGGAALITLRLSTEAQVFGNAVHEVIHELAHPAFGAAFGSMHEKNITEGFTEYFTRQVVSSDRSGSYQDVYEAARNVRDVMSGPFRLPSIGTTAAEESLRLAYFRGRLDLIGWLPSSRAEELIVAAKGGSARWDAATAGKYAAADKAEAQAIQAASRNVLGVGVFFGRQSTGSPTITARYTRVLARTEPYARGQLLLEAQFLGSPVGDPKALGASLGLGVEYQEPYFYAVGGARFVGTAVQGSATNRLDFSPFAGLGIRAWQTIRVGAEGFVLLPLIGQDVSWGAGATLGVEF